MFLLDRSITEKTKEVEHFFQIRRLYMQFESFKAEAAASPSPLVPSASIPPTTL